MYIKAALEVFGLSGTVSPQLIKQRYRSLCKEYHPDRNPAGLEMMQMVNQAYDCLKEIKDNVVGQDSENLNYAQDVAIAIAAILECHLDIEICGTWVWVSGETKDHKETLKAAGFKWSPKKKIWHFRPHSDKKSRYHGKATMDDIRGKYGSKVVNARKKIGA